MVDKRERQEEEKKGPQSVILFFVLAFFIAAEEIADDYLTGMRSGDSLSLGVQKQITMADQQLK